MNTVSALYNLPPPRICGNCRICSRFYTCTHLKALETVTRRFMKSVGWMSGCQKRAVSNAANEYGLCTNNCWLRRAREYALTNLPLGAATCHRGAATTCHRGAAATKYSMRVTMYTYIVLIFLSIKRRRSEAASSRFYCGRVVKNYDYYRENFEKLKEKSHQKLWLL